MDKGKSSSAPGQQKPRTLTRTNPSTGETETQEVTQAQWKDKAQRAALEAEGWSREDGDEEEEESTSGETTGG